MSSKSLFIPGLALASRPKRGMVFPDFDAFGIRRGIVGADNEGQGGFNDRRDVVLTQTIDGVDLNGVWAEFQQTVRLQNAQRQTIIDLLTFPVTQPFESVSQLSSANFEEASEYGEPRGMRQRPTSFSLGYDFKWYDLASRFTWQYLAEATAAQVESLNAVALDADNRLIYGKVLDALFTPTNRQSDINGNAFTVYSLYNGDGTVPPAYKSNTFDGTHTHYLTSGAATITSGDVDDMVEHLRHHGYDSTNGVTQVLLANSREGKVIRTFRIANGDTYDFIPAQGQPLDLILDLGQSLQATQPAATYQGLNVIGKYGDVLIIEDDMFPPTYAVLIGTGGRANLNNPVGIREHANPGLRGLRLVKGADPDYPLIDSFYNRGFGTGIRQRGGSVIMQITASATYTKPSAYIYA